MQPFTFRIVDSDRQAIEAAQHPGVRLLAGGTTIIDLMKLHLERPGTLVDINGIGLDRIEELPDGGVRVGALVRNSDMAHHALIQERYPFLSRAILAGASPQLRNMATTAGNLMQRTRCYYFRDTATACNKREPGSGCSAIEGYNRIHAILGTSAQCIATHPSDMCVPLVALDARVRVRNASGERAIPIADFHLLPGDHPEREHAIGSGDLITAVDIPPVAFAARSVYLKVRDRASYAFALASAAVALDIDNGAVREARVAFGGIATKPWRAREAESALAGRRPDMDAWRAAADAALHEAIPRQRNAFKVELAKRTLVRALVLASGAST